MFFAYMNQLLLCPDFTDSCLLAIWFSVEVLVNRQILYKNVSTFIWTCPSIGIRPEMMYGTISGALEHFMVVREFVLPSFYGTFPVFLDFSYLELLLLGHIIRLE
jgi:hypothetical protein